MDTSTNTTNVTTSSKNKFPNFYSLVSNPNIQAKGEEELRVVAKTSQQSSPSLYSIVINQLNVSNITELAGTFNSTRTS